ncbi:hypothetical protein ACHQM5_029148 [Ranunculus cassubicifolius]
MEGKVVRAMFLIVIVFGGMVLEQSYAESLNSFKNCYGLCFLGCMIKPDRNVFKCGFNCLKSCAFRPQDAISDTHRYCELGCASSKCLNISTEGNPGAEAMEGCVMSCSDLCTKN